MKVSTILDSIDLGSVALPEFQRGYVWNREQVRGLLHSLYKRYPVGSLLVWETKTESAKARGDGDLAAGVVKLLLDGQQRITSLYGIIRGKPPKFKFCTYFNCYQIRLTAATKDRFRAECERCKIELSEQIVRAIELAGYLRVSEEVLDLSEEVSRSDFEQEILSDIEQAGLQVDRALDAAELTARQVDLVLLIGGSSRIPLVQQRMRERFGHTVVNIENADSIIAEGAAIADALGLGPAFAASVAVELSDGTHHDVFKAGELAKPGICNKTLNLFCTDNRDGVARLIVGLADSSNGRFDRKTIVTFPVSSELPRPYNHERVAASFRLDEDLVLHIDAKAATQEGGAHEEIVDLRFALSEGGASDEVESLGSFEPDA